MNSAWNHPRTIVSVLILILGSIACNQMNPEQIEWPQSPYPETMKTRKTDIHPLEIAFMQAGMIDVHSLDTSIRVHLRYGTTNNFMGSDLYNGFNKCFLQPEVASRLVKAQQLLRIRNPDLSLLVWDAARPLAVQQRMWDEAVPPPGVHKSEIVSNPAYGSIHNYGCAVDLTIIHLDGTLLDMGSDFDDFNQIAWPKMEDTLLKNGKLTRQQVTNRQLLRSIMYGAGFWNIQTEWWHFNAMRRNAARKLYPNVP
jgi:zinc D-Ala-D-Ala dipeptidase